MKTNSVGKYEKYEAEGRKERRKEKKRGGEKNGLGNKGAFASSMLLFLSGKETVAAKPNRGLIGLLGLDVIPSIVNTLRDTKYVSPRLCRSFLVSCPDTSRRVRTRSCDLSTAKRQRLDARKWWVYEILNLKIREKSIFFFFNFKIEMQLKMIFI